MTWGDWYFLGAWLLLGGSGIWASVTGGPDWVFVALAAVGVVHILLMEADNRWGAFRSLRRGITRVAAWIGGGGPAANVKVATDAVARIQDAVAVAERRCGAASEPSSEARAALLETKAEIERGGALFGRIAADYDGAAASFRTLQAELSGASARVDGLLAAPEWSAAEDATAEEAATAEREVEASSRDTPAAVCKETDEGAGMAITRGERRQVAVDGGDG